MLPALLLLVFIVGYAAIAFEHAIGLNKAASALLCGVACWTVYALGATDFDSVHDSLMHHLAEIASILFFLLGAMTIVEVIDGYSGFDVITRRMRTTSYPRLLLLITALSFLLSAILDNLTTAIVMTSLTQKLMARRAERLPVIGMIVIAANAGGVWSPLGDVTTTMLWIGGQVTAIQLVLRLVLPSLAVAGLPLLLLCLRFRGRKFATAPPTGDTAQKHSLPVLVMGIALLLFVPLFKIATHLPPFMGMMAALGLMWAFIAVLHLRASNTSDRYDVHVALERIDTPSILFFMGILLAVGALQASGLLTQLGTALDNGLPHPYAVGGVLGVLSALLDNVPLVAGAQGMYPLSRFPADAGFWHFLALTTGTGGSLLIIGSAAGVAVMGMEGVPFGWYLKRMMPLALLGLLGGIGVYLLMWGW